MKHAVSLRVGARLLAAASMSSAGLAQSNGIPIENGVTAFTNVTIVPMDVEHTVPSQTVLVRQGRIIGIGPAESIRIPRDALSIDGRGRYLVPGLVDMHVHLRDYPENDMAALLELYIAAGVTTVLNLRGIPRHLELRDRVAKGTLLGPTIYTSGPFISATTGSSPTPEEVERAVVEQKQAGYDIIKIHGDFTREAYHKLFEVARRERIRVIGHSPRNLGYEVMFEERQDAVAHAEEYIYDTNSRPKDSAAIEPKFPEIARATAAVGTWLVPNLTAYHNIAQQLGDIDAVLGRSEMRYIPPAVVRQWTPPSNPYLVKYTKADAGAFFGRYAMLERLTKAFRDAGVRLLVGTDAMNPSVVPGFSVHDELRDLVHAGLTPYEALRAATAGPAEFLGASAEFGTIAVGRRADLILVGADPLVDVAAASRRIGVMLRGRWFPESELEANLGATAASYRRP